MKARDPIATIVRTTQLAWSVATVAALAWWIFLLPSANSEALRPVALLLFAIGFPASLGAMLLLSALAWLAVDVTGHPLVGHILAFGILIGTGWLQWWGAVPWIAARWRRHSEGFER